MGTQDFVISREDHALNLRSNNSALLAKTQILFELLRARLGTLQEEQFPRLVEEMVEIIGVESDAGTLKQARLNAQAQARFVSEHSLLTAEAVHEQKGLSGKNRASTASRLRKKGDVFGVTYRGQILYPAFQFGDDGQPLPIIGEVLRQFGGRLSDWQIAIWFSTPNGWLGDAKPEECLKEDPSALLEAARDEVEPAVY